MSGTCPYKDWSIRKESCKDKLDRARWDASVTIPKKGRRLRRFMDSPILENCWHTVVFLSKMILLLLIAVGPWFTLAKLEEYCKTYSSPNSTHIWFCSSNLPADCSQAWAYQLALETEGVLWAVWQPNSQTEEDKSSNLDAEQRKAFDYHFSFTLRQRTFSAEAPLETWSLHQGGLVARDYEHQFRRGLRETASMDDVIPIWNDSIIAPMTKYHRKSKSSLSSSIFPDLFRRHANNTDCREWTQVKKCVSGFCEVDVGHCAQKRNQANPECQWCSDKVKNNPKIQQHCCEKEKKEQKTLIILGSIFLAVLATIVVTLVYRDCKNKAKLAKLEKRKEKFIEEKTKELEARRGLGKCLDGASDSPELQQHWWYRTGNRRLKTDVEEQTMPVVVSTSNSGRGSLPGSSNTMFARIFNRGNPLHDSNLYDVRDVDKIFTRSADRTPVLPTAVSRVHDSQRRDQGRSSSQSLPSSGILRQRNASDSLNPGPLHSVDRPGGRLALESA